MRLHRQNDRLHTVRHGGNRKHFAHVTRDTCLMPLNARCFSVAISDFNSVTVNEKNTVVPGLPRTCNYRQTNNCC